MGRRVKHSVLPTCPTSKSCQGTRLERMLRENASYLDKTPESLVSDQIKHFTEKLLENPEERWKELMNVGDEYSVRQWFKSKKKYVPLSQWIIDYLIR